MLWTTAVGALLATLSSATDTARQHDGVWTLAPFIAIAVAAEFLRVDVYQARQQRITLSFSVAATMAAIAAQPAGAPLVSLLAAIVATLVVLRQRRLDRLLFNLANPVLASLAAAWVYCWLRPVGGEVTLWYLAATVAAALAYVGVNVGLVSLMISLHSGRPLPAVLRESGWFAPTNILLGVTGAFVGGAHEQLGPLLVGMFVTPVLLMRYTLAFYARLSRATIRTLEGQATTLEQQAERLEHQALHDSLTELPNRAHLERRLRAALASGANLALLLLDLDGFKEINDTFGHQHGDVLLRQVGPRLRRALPEDDLVARLGGDEFAVVLSRTAPDQAEEAARTLLRALEQPFVVDGLPLEIGASIGIATSSQQAPEATTLLRQADVAMYVAKRGRTGVAVYRPEDDHYSAERLVLVGELRDAIDRDLLTLVYQPQVACRTGRLAAVETLLRWQHPERGWIPPDQFVPLAEHTGLIRPLTRWVLRGAMDQCRAWLDQGRLIPVSVNVSTHDLQDPSLPDEIAELLDSTGVPSHCLQLEVTEGALMSDAARARDVLGRIRALGVQVAIDDFGTGYSSLAYLSQLPVDELKIDRSFLRGIHDPGNNAAIVRSTISLGHELGLRVVAEGVEDEATWDLLARLDCDLGQGYWIGRPLASPALAQWLARAPFTVQTTRAA
ncbi:MAG: bifunctional diguanylate cyclase/phosphodiesterase [Chloroflexota bacterium]|nr:bifunctional diguanylate cyclase/phosphodiesterase [Chloroflexota bacterium]